jgi:hypothetical protein
MAPGATAGAVVRMVLTQTASLAGRRGGSAVALRSGLSTGRGSRT